MTSSLLPLAATSSRVVDTQPSSLSGRASWRRLHRTGALVRGVAMWVPFLVASCGRSSGDAASQRSADSVSAVTIAAPSATSGGRSSASAVEPLMPESPARDADQRFLRQMLDHHERIIRLVHERVSEPAAHREHGASTDPLATDMRLDNEKLEMAALLKSLYNDEHSPRPLRSPDSTAHLARTQRDSARASASADTGMGGQAERVYQETLGDGLRHGVALIDQSRPALRRANVRALADRLRQTQLALLREITGS